MLENRVTRMFEGKGQIIPMFCYTELIGGRAKKSKER